MGFVMGNVTLVGYARIRRRARPGQRKIRGRARRSLALEPCQGSIISTKVAAAIRSNGTRV